jgi:hypothetical protein
VLGFQLIGAATERAAFLGQARYLYFPCHQGSRIASSSRWPQVTPERDAGKRGARSEQRRDTEEDAYIHFNSRQCSCYVHTVQKRGGKAKTAMT